MQSVDEYVNLPDALNRVRGNKKLYRRLLESFLNDSGMDVLEKEIKSGDFSAAARAAHSIKGASANLSFTKFTGTVKELEAGLKAGGCDKAALRACLDAFDETKRAVGEILDIL